MPLQDHFHPPLHGAFHNAWATNLAADLNQHLPQGYYAEPNVQFRIEIDVAALETNGSHPELTESWQPTGPVLSAPITLISDVVEVNVISNMGGLVLVGAIELISPSNKHGPEERAAFAGKCAAYLREGAGVIMVDVVTERHGNLHNDLLELLQTKLPPMADELYACAYRPIRRDGKPCVDVWPKPLTLGGSLPTVPLWLQGAICIPVPLEETYTKTCRGLRITVNGA